MRAIVVAIALILVSLGPTTAALADGEAGVVIDYGDGRIETACVAFAGDGIAGDELLVRAGVEVNHFSGLVCSIDEVGCHHSGSFDSCTCECGSGDPCVYWAFFSQEYGDAAWRYSSLGFRGLDARDGDLQAWRWGEGRPGAAPAPALLSFEDVCGHPPSSFVTPTAVSAGTTPTALPTPTAAAEASAMTAPASPTPPPDEAASVTATPAGPTTVTAESSLPASTTTLIRLTTEPSPQASAASAASPDGGGGAGSLVAFTAAAGGLLLLFGGVLLWRRGRGTGR